MRCHAEAMPDTTPMTPPRRHRAARTTTVVVGAIVGLLAFGMLALGGVLLWADSKKDEQGYIHTDTQRFSTHTAAIATDNLDLDSSGPGWLTSHDRYGHMRLEVSSRNDKPVFVGIARTKDATAYLRGTAHATVTDFHSDPFRAVYRAEPGSARSAPAAPASKRMWAASAHGKGTQTVIWDVKHGDWSVVVMNADGSRGVDAGVSAGADFPILSALAWGSVGGGLVLLGVASLLIVMGTTAQRRAPAPALAPA
jgi:hypothetical protein